MKRKILFLIFTLIIIAITPAYSVFGADNLTEENPTENFASSENAEIIFSSQMGTIAELGVEFIIPPISIETNQTTVNYQTLKGYILLPDEQTWQKIPDVTVGCSTIFLKLGTVKIYYTVCDENEKQYRSQDYQIQVIDTTAPTVEVPDIVKRAKIYSQVQIPYAEISDADENYSVQRSVTFKGEKVEYSKGIFITTQLGTYEVTYTVTDSSFNKTVKTYQIEVYDDEKPKIKVDFPKEIFYGQTFTIPQPDVTDNYFSSEQITLSVEVLSPEEEPIQEKEGQIKITKLGEYLILYKAKDGAGNESTLFKRVTAKAVAPTLQVDCESLTGVVGVEIVLPTAVAHDALKNFLPIDASVKFGGNQVAISNGAFIPQQAGEYVLTFSATDLIIGEKTVKEIKIIVSEVQKEQGDSENKEQEEQNPPSTNENQNLSQNNKKEGCNASYGAQSAVYSIILFSVVALRLKRRR